MGYQWTAQLSFEAVDWATDADEWMHWVAVCLAEQEAGVHHSGVRIDDTTRPFTELSADRSDGTPSSTYLLLLGTPSGVLVSFGGREGELDDQVASAWTAAVACATSRLGHESQTFEWTAIIGPRGGGRFALADVTRIGPFELIPGGRPLTMVESGSIMPSLHSRTPSLSWPALVRGSHEGYSWPDTSKRVHATSGASVLCSHSTANSTRGPFWNPGPHSHGRASDSRSWISVLLRAAPNP